MHAEFSYAHFEWSFCAMYHYFHNQNINFVEQGAWKNVALLFIGATRRSIVSKTVHAVFVPVFQCHALKRHRPIVKKVLFFFSCT